MGAEVIVSAPQVALEFLCREYAAGVMRPMFHAMLAIAKRYQDQKTVIRLRGQWIEVDPDDWPADMDVDVMVGLGSGTKQDRLVGLMAIMQKQAELQAKGSPLVTPQNEAEALKTFAELQGYKNTGRFFTEMSPEELARPSRPRRSSRSSRRSRPRRLPPRPRRPRPPRCRRKRRPERWRRARSTPRLPKGR